MLKIAIPVFPGDHYPNYFAALDALGAQGCKIAADTPADEYAGLLLPGGGDVDPARYGQENRGSGGIDPDLDALQFAACDHFVRAKKPVLGICRGHQLVNVYFGGTLIQDLPSGGVHDWDPGESADKVHVSTALPGTWIAALYGERYPTNSAHHQAVDRPGRGLVIDSYSEDGVVEAMHHESLPVYAVQFHPERMCFAHRRDDTVDGSVLLRWFLSLCG